MKNLFSKRDRKAESLAVGEFAHAHKDLIIIVADPADDSIFVAYNDRFTSGRIRTADGKEARIVRDLMSTSKFFDSNIDRFLMGLADVLQVKRLSFGVNNFLQYLDGALYNISMRHRKKQPAAGEGSLPSPLQPDAAGRLREVEDISK